METSSYQSIVLGQHGYGKNSTCIRLHKYNHAGTRLPLSCSGLSRCLDDALGILLFVCHSLGTYQCKLHPRHINSVTEECGALPIWLLFSGRNSYCWVSTCEERLELPVPSVRIFSNHPIHYLRPLYFVFICRIKLLTNLRRSRKTILHVDSDVFHYILHIKRLKVWVLYSPISCIVEH